MAADGTLVLVVHFVSELICLLLSTETRKHGSVFPIACKATRGSAQMRASHGLLRLFATFVLALLAGYADVITYVCPSMNAKVEATLACDRQEGSFLWGLGKLDRESSLAGTYGTVLVAMFVRLSNAPTSAWRRFCWFCR